MPMTEKSGSSCINLLFRDVKVSTTKKELMKVGAGGFSSRKAHSHSWPLVAGCRQEASFPHHRNLSTGLLVLPYNMVANVPQSGQYRKEHGRSHSIFYDLALEVTLHPSTYILLAT